MILGKKRNIVLFWITGLLLVSLDFIYCKDRFIIDTIFILLILIFLTCAYFRIKSKGGR